MPAEPSDNDTKSPIPAPPDDTERERAMREAEARALAESGLGSGLLARASVVAESETVAVLKVCPQCGTEYETAARFCPNDGTALRPKGSDTLIGRVLADRYHILKLIGEGGMGRVYLGEHVKMNRQCAIKVMSPALVNDAESAARFAREASNAARIIHPNVAAVFDFGESDGLVYLVMEFVDGEPLSRLLTREAPLSLDRAISLARQITDGLGAAHELGIVHRDLKPDNILITRARGGRETAKVVDFGIAKAIQEHANDALTRTGPGIGTPEFMSPEQLLGDPVDARSDLYALGCILHLMLTAAPPFEAPTREQMIKRRLSEDAPPVHGVDPAIPDTVARIVARLLARSPSDRYGSAAELHDALGGSHLRRSGVQRVIPADERPTPRSAPTVAFLQATQATTEVTTIPVHKPVRKAPFVIGGIALAAAAAGLYVYNIPTPVQAERQVSLASESLHVNVAAPLPADTVVPAPKDTTSAVAANVPMVDTVAYRAKLAKQRETDSLRRIAEAEINLARAPIVRLKQAIESGNIAILKAANPSMTPAQEKMWQDNFFSRAEKIDAEIRYGPTKILGDSAEAAFRINLKILFKDTRTGSVPINQHATLVKGADGWRIVSLRQ